MTTDPAESPIELIRSRLVNHRGRYREISKRYGFGYSWLSQFARGTRGSCRPSFDLISRLQAALDEIEGTEERLGQATNGSATHGG